MEFTREDWDFILDQDDPDFAQKFDALIRKYACRAYEDKSNFPDRSSVIYVYSLTASDNWLCKIRMSTPDLLFGQKHYDLAKYKVFLSCLSAIGMLYDYANVFLLVSVR